MTDIEIARNTKLEKIVDIAKKVDIDEEYIEQYGKYKAKISEKVYEKIKNNKDGKLILVTAMSPTPLGEGKTTISIAVADGLQKIGKKSILALREPSLGPVFGIKGGATGGGKVQIAPMEDINLHFTGDIHAMTSANNLLSAMIDNHIYFGNELGFDRVVWKRCMDLNDRQLRQVNTGLSGESKIVPREDKFDITVASEIMAIMCLSNDINDLKRRLGNIIVGYKKDNTPIYAHDLNRRADSIARVTIKRDSLIAKLPKEKKVQVELVAVIEDGVTTRKVQTAAILDTIRENDMRHLTKTITAMATNMAKDRQTEIDTSKTYYKLTKNDNFIQLE